MNIDIHSNHPALSSSDEHALRDQARAIFAPYAARLSEVRLRLTDQNGPRKGEDLQCIAVARFGRGGAAVAVTSLSEPNLPAITTALKRLRRWVRKSLERRRDRHRRNGAT